jgi:hypothetical protein
LVYSLSGIIPIVRKLPPPHLFSSGIVSSAREIFQFEKSSRFSKFI